MPKPVLSDLEYNADDVASAILSNADLSVTNQDFGVEDITEYFVKESGFASWSDEKCVLFNGFVFVSLNTYINDGHANYNATGMDAYTITNSDYYPNQDYWMTSSSHQDDTSLAIMIKDTGKIFVSNAVEQGADDNHHIVINGWYRVN